MSDLRPRPDEAELVGHWVDQGGRVVADETTRRIEALVRDWLTPLPKANRGWERLFRDPADGRIWEMTYPMGEMHGGGPPALRVISAEVAANKYGIQV